MPKTSAYLSDEVAEQAHQSGVALGELVRRGLRERRYSQLADQLEQLEKEGGWEIVIRPRTAV